MVDKALKLIDVFHLSFQLPPLKQSVSSLAGGVLRMNIMHLYKVSYRLRKGCISDARAKFPKFLYGSEVVLTIALNNYAGFGSKYFPLVLEPLAESISLPCRFNYSTDL
jgi:hypothetical protein